MIVGIKVGLLLSARHTLTLLDDLSCQILTEFTGRNGRVPLISFFTMDFTAASDYVTFLAFNDNGVLKIIQGCRLKL